MSTQSEYEAAWRGLEEAAAKHKSGDMASAQRLLQACLRCSAAHAAMNAKSSPSPSSYKGGRANDAFRVPFGRSKGKMLSECDDRDLAWLANAVGENIRDPERERFRSQNEKMLAAINAEIAHRNR